MMDQAGRRRQVLLAWAFLQRNRGEAVPTNDELGQIAMARAVPPGLRTPVVNRWAHVLHHLMWLSDQGHPDPVKDALGMAPAGPPVGGQNMGPPVQQRPQQVPPPQLPPQQYQRPPGPPGPPQQFQQPPGQPGPPQQFQQPPGQPGPPQQFQQPPGMPPQQVPPTMPPPGPPGSGGPPQPVAPAPGFGEMVRQKMDALTDEINKAAAAAEAAIARGNEAEARPWLLRRSVLKQQLSKLVRGDADSTQPVPGSQLSASGQPSAVGQASAAGLPSAAERSVIQPPPVAPEPTGAAASAVPPPPVPPFPSSMAPPGQHQPPGQPQPAHQPSEPVHQPSAPHQPTGPNQQPAGPLSAQSAAGAPPAADIDPLQELMMWRDRNGHEALKDRHLRQIVNSGARNAAEVGAGLPASLKPLAGGIAEVLGLGGGEPARALPSPEVGGPGGPLPQHGGVLDLAQAGLPAQPAPVSEPAPSRAADSPELFNPQAISWQQPLELADELSRFAEMDFTQPAGEPLAIKAAPRPDGTLTLRWPAPVDAAPVTIYRVVSDDEHVPFSPDMSEVIGVTGATSFVDARPFPAAVRHYQVWVNSGASAEEAFLEQPRLHAGVPVVAKPADVDIREDEGRVIGQWTVLGDVRRVQIFRVPAERAGSGSGNPMYRICADDPNLGGFVDDGAEPGRRYVYQLLVEAEVEGVARLSLPTVVQLTTSAVLQPIADLRCTLGDDPGQPHFDLEWTAPQSGRVVVYRTPAGPLAGSDADTVDESALPQMRLRPEDRLAHPIVMDGTRSSMRDVPWPRGWSRTYFTPVTLIDGKARVGRTTSQVRTGTVEDARIVERVMQQVLTMDWPEGAAAIKVYASPPGQPPADAIDGAEPIAEISQETYIRLGGLHFTRPLDTGGCDLHLLPISFAGGQAVLGQPATVHYRGLLKLWYALEVRRATMGRGPVLMNVRIRSDRPNPTSPPFALVHNQHRLPLDVNDGDSIMVRPATDQPAPWSPRFRPMSLAPQWSDPGWVADVTNRTGWVRVFVDLPPDPNRGTVALLDPPVAQLYLGGGR